MVPRISSASLRGPGEFAFLTWLAMIALVWKEIINSSARNVDNFHPLKGSRQPKKAPLSSLTKFISRAYS